MGVVKAQPVSCLIVGRGCSDVCPLCSSGVHANVAQAEGQEPGAVSTAKKSENALYYQRWASLWAQW